MGKREGRVYLTCSTVIINHSYHDDLCFVGRILEVVDEAKRAAHTAADACRHPPRRLRTLIPRRRARRTRRARQARRRWTILVVTIVATARHVATRRVVRRPSPPKRMPPPRRP